MEYWRQIGIQVEIKTVDVGYGHGQAEIRGSLKVSGPGAMARRVEPISYYSLLYSKSGVVSRRAWMGIADPVYDALYEAAVATETDSRGAEAAG